MNEIDKILGKTYRMKKAGRDSDGDGVINIIDCKPYNPRKQGVIHKVGAAVLRKLGKDELAQKTEARGEQIDENRAEVRRIRIEERQKQALETAKFREEQRGKSRRRYAESGGFVGQLGRGVGQLGRGIQTLSKPQARASTATPSRRKITRYVKTKGGKFKKVTSYKTTKTPVRSAVAQTPPRPTMLDLLSGKKPQNGKSMKDFKFF